LNTRFFSILLICILAVSLLTGCGRVASEEGSTDSADDYVILTPADGSYASGEEDSDSEDEQEEEPEEYEDEEEDSSDEDYSGDAPVTQEWTLNEIENIYEHYRAVLNSTETIRITSSSSVKIDGGGYAAYLEEINDFLEENDSVGYSAGNFEADSLAFVDLDQDGVDEVCISISDSDQFYLILHFYDNEVYGYIMPARGFESVSTSGTYLGSAGGSAYTYILKTGFNGAKQIETTLAHAESEDYYGRDNKSITKQEFERMVDEVLDDPAEWYDFDDNSWESAIDQLES